MTVTLPDTTLTSSPLDAGHASADPEQQPSVPCRTTDVPAEGTASAAAVGTEEERAYWQRRLERLTEAWQGVRCERDVAIYRLHQQGVPVREIARVADESPHVVADMIATAAGDPNMADYPPGPLWHEFWPKY
ncbi:hypothetical protein [Actinocatenispora rupis]|uniref:Uncharacterized protein n=1 Tax=Actinocatenispora rupis TaxID=519421 RepID=A0A8J3NDC9_9ACTN|nr:hypothetical protein [Actinocatenispora rupis]GID14931.1 hypothetical protein Aru02nite_58200 [Actinocatenispora rupis]